MLSLRQLFRSRRGAAAVEFAFIAPIMVLLFFGLIELSEGMNARQRMENVAATSADLVAQSTNMTPTAISNVFAAANAIMYPYPTNVKIVISSVQDDPANSLSKGKVVWSKCTANTTARAAGDLFTIGGTGANTIPTGVITAGGSVILAEVSYSFTPVTHYVIGGSVNMSTRFFSRPRRTVQVTWSNS
ncbi:MAG: TadE/TadG family type IV pilus assembly protein [Alphaproteobacteria bacterium]